MTLVPFAQLLFTLMIRAYMVSARRSPMALWLCRLGAIQVQVVLAIFTVGMWISQTRDVFIYFSPRWLFLVLAMSALAARVAAYLLAPAFSGRQRVRLVTARLGSVTPSALRSFAAMAAVLAVSIAVLLPSLFTSQNAALSLWTVSWHLPFTLDEYAAVLNGRSLQVDFFPQYQNLLPYLFIPVYQMFGLTIATFTSPMCVLSVIALLCVYDVFVLITKNHGYALAMYLAFLGISSYASESGATQVANVFNYYAWPMRLVLPSLAMWLTVRYLIMPTPAKMLGVFVAGSFAAINNLDFGLPALIGCVAAVLSNSERRGLVPWLRDVGRVIGVLTVAILMAIGTLAALTVVRSGHLPNVGMVLSFQRVFLRYGYFMIPMPTWGIQWLVFVTLMAALATGATAVLSRTALSSRASPGLLIYAAIFGCGVAMYYVGRSDPYSLIIVFWPWALCLLLLLWETTYAGLQRVWLPPLGDDGLLLLPWFLLFVHCGLFWSNLAHLRNPVAQVERLSRTTDLWATAEDTIVAMIRGNTTPGEKVGIAFPYGHLLALRADVDDVFPFAHPNSMILREQVHLAVQAFATNRVSSVFGSFTGEFRTELRGLGFRAARAVRIRYPQFPRWFEMWVKMER